MSDLVPPGVWSVAYRQWQGARAYQEDDFEIVEEAFGAGSATAAVLMVLADGMGGEAGGALASRCVVEAFVHRFGQLPGTTATRLNACLDLASDALESQVRAEPELEGMGSTVVAALYDGHSLTWLSVGDSPMWMFADGRLTRLNADHSMAPVLDRMAETGELSPREALSDERRHMLRSAVTGEEVELIDCAQRSCRLERGEYLVLASDGLETLAVHQIERLLGEAESDANRAADALISAVRAANRPHQDNVTLLVLAGQEAGAGGRVLPSSQSDDTVVTNASGRPSSSGGRRVVAASLLAAGLVVAVSLIWWQIVGDIGRDSEFAPEQDWPAGQPSPVAPSATPVPAERPAAKATDPAAPRAAEDSPSTQGRPAGKSPTATHPQEGESQRAGEPASPEPADRGGSEPPGAAAPDAPEVTPSTQGESAGESPPATRPEEAESRGESQRANEPSSTDPGDSVPEPAGRGGSEPPAEAAPGAPEAATSTQGGSAASESPPATRPEEPEPEAEPRRASEPAAAGIGDSTPGSTDVGGSTPETTGHGGSASEGAIAPVDRNGTSAAKDRSDSERATR